MKSRIQKNMQCDGWRAGAILHRTSVLWALLCAVLFAAVLLIGCSGDGISVEASDTTTVSVESSLAGDATGEGLSAPNTPSKKSESKKKPSSQKKIYPLTVQFIDVGQADAALVGSKGHYMLIDGGNRSDSSLIYSVLKRKNIRALDMVVGTHAHEDHIGGLPGAYQFASVSRTICPTRSYNSDAFRNFAAAAKKSGGIHIPSVGTHYKLGAADVTVLGVNGGSDVNDTSIVLMVSYGKTSILFAGDAGRDAEQAILNRGTSLDADVLKVGHHGSASSTTYPFLREIMPRYGVISVGSGNSYGHPTDDALSRLRDADVKVFRTDMQGDIKLSSNGSKIKISVERNKSANTLRAPSASRSSGSSRGYGVVPPVTSGGGSSRAKADYVLNLNTKKFHYPSCSSVDDMAAHNKKYFEGPRKKVIAMGFVPCKRCNP